MIRIGMLTSGGDCQALNAAMRGVAKTMYNSNEDVEIYGFLNGYQGLIYGRFRLLSYADFSGILTEGGTFLGSSRTPYKTIREPDENGPGQGRGDEAELLQAAARLPGHPRRQRHPQDRQPAARGGPERRHPAQDDRQRPLGHGHDLRLPERGGRRHRRPSTASTPPPPRTGACSSSRSWATASAG